MELLRRAVPGLAALTSYERGWVAPDLVAGIRVWASDPTSAQVINELIDGLRDELAGSHIAERIGADHVYLEVDDGVAAFQAQIPVASQEG